MTTPYYADDAVTLYCGDFREEQCAKAVEWRLSQAVLPFELGTA